jgi:hypothetical protein
MITRDRQTRKFNGLPDGNIKLYYEKLDEIDNTIRQLVQEAHGEQIGTWFGIVRSTKSSMRKVNPTQENQMIRYWLNLAPEPKNKTKDELASVPAKVITNFRDTDGTRLSVEDAISLSNEGASAVFFLCFGSAFVTTSNTGSVKVRANRIDFTKTNGSSDRELIISEVPHGVDYGDVDASAFLGVAKEREPESDEDNKENKRQKMSGDVNKRKRQHDDENEGEKQIRLEDQEEMKAAVPDDNEDDNDDGDNGTIFSSVVY